MSTRINTIATWNVYNHNTPRRVMDGIRHMHKVHDPDVIVLQEVSPFIAEIRKVAKELGYAVIVGARVRKRGMALQEARSTVILRRSRIPVLSSGFIRILSTWIGPKARLRRPGRSFPTFKGGDPAIRVAGIHNVTGRKRFRQNRTAWQETLRKLNRRVDRWSKAGLPMVLIGDMNESWSNKDPESLSIFARQNGMRIIHDEAKIDFALIKGFANARYQSYSKMGSDTHRYGVLTLVY